MFDIKNKESHKQFDFILIIDDELPILKILSMLLSRKGYVVHTSDNGKEAIRKIEYHNYDLILTDIKMPGISGDQILNYVKNQLGRFTPVVGMSGTPWLLTKYKFDAVLEKPCKMDELLQVIQQFSNGILLN